MRIGAGWRAGAASAGVASAGAGRRSAGAVSVGAASAGAGRRSAGSLPVGAGPAHARFAGEIAGKYGPIRPGVRSGQPLVFRVSSQEKKDKGRERTPFRSPERSGIAAPVAPAREKPEIRYRDIVRDRPGPAGKDRVIEREKVVQREKLVEREKVVEREKIVERRTIVVREAVRVVVEQRRIREAALAADLTGHQDESPDSSGIGRERDASASAKTSGKARKNKKSLPGNKTSASLENKTAASTEAKSRVREPDDEAGDGLGETFYETSGHETPRRETSGHEAPRDGASEQMSSRRETPGRDSSSDGATGQWDSKRGGSLREAPGDKASRDEGSRASKHKASPRGRTSFAESLTQRTAWPLSAKANAAFRKARDKAAAAKIPLGVRTPNVTGSRKKSATGEQGSDAGDGLRSKQPAYAQLLFVNPKLRADGSRFIGAPEPQASSTRAGLPSSAEAARQPERLSGSSEARGNAEPGLPPSHVTETRLEERTPGGVTSPHPTPPTNESRLAEAREDRGRLDDNERVVDGSRKAGKRRSGKAAREPSRQEQASQSDDLSLVLSDAGSPPGINGGLVVDNAQEYAESWRRPAFRLSHVSRPGSFGAEAPSSGGSAEEQPASPLGRLEESQAAEARFVEAQPSLSGRSWLLRKPGVDSPLPLVYRSLSGAGLPIAAKGSLGKKAAGTQTAGEDLAKKSLGSGTQPTGTDLGKRTAGLNANVAGKQSTGTDLARTVGLNANVAGKQPISEELAKRTIGLSAKAAADLASGDPVRERRRIPLAETKLGLAAGSLKLSHRLTGSSPRIGSIGRNAAFADETTGKRSSERAKSDGTKGTGNGADQGLQTPGRIGEPGRDSAGGVQSPRVRANVRETGAVDQVAEEGQRFDSALPAPAIRANALETEKSGRDGGRRQGLEGGVPVPMIHTNARGPEKSGRVGERNQGLAGEVSAPTVRTDARGTERPGQPGESVRDNSSRATPIQVGVRGTGSRANDKTDLRIPGSANAETIGARGRIHPGKLVLLARSEGTQRAGGRTSAANRSSAIGSIGSLGQRNPLIPAENPDRLAAHRQSGKPSFPLSQTEASRGTRTSMLLRRNLPLEIGPDKFVNPEMPAARRSETAAGVVTWNVQPHDASGTAVDDRQRDLSPSVRVTGRRRPLSSAIADGREGRTALPAMLAVRPIRRSTQDPRLPIQQDSTVQTGRVEAPRLSLAHAAPSATGERRDASETVNAAESPAHTHEQDTNLEFRRNATITAEGSSQIRNVAPEPAPEISEEALQKAISSLPQLHPDQLADQVYKSLMKRMKMEQRLHGF